jgi:hypothetical protein
VLSEAFSAFASGRDESGPEAAHAEMLIEIMTISQCRVIVVGRNNCMDSPECPSAYMMHSVEDRNQILLLPARRAGAQTAKSYGGDDASMAAAIVVVDRFTKWRKQDDKS